MKRAYAQFRKAVREGDAETALEMLRASRRLHREDGEAGTPLEILANDRPEWLEAAFQLGLSPNAQPDERPQTVLQHAVAEGNLELVRGLIRYGVDLERRNDWGEVALGYSCSHGQLDAAKLLVEAGANVNAVEFNPETGYRNTPLDCTSSQPELAVYLRSHGAKYLRELEPADP